MGSDWGVPPVDRRGQGSTGSAVKELTLACSSRHRATDFAENSADAGGNAGHNGARGNRYESCHEGIFDKVLPACVFPNPQFPDQICYLLHSSLLSLELHAAQQCTAFDVPDAND